MGLRFGRPGCFCAQITVFFKPKPLPGLLGPAVVSAGLQSAERSGAGFIIFPMVCPVSYGRRAVRQLGVDRELRSVLLREDGELDASPPRLAHDLLAVLLLRTRGGRFKGLKNMCFLRRPGPREPPKSAGNGGPRGSQISSDCPRKSLDFEIGVRDRLDTGKIGTIALRALWEQLYVTQ